MNDGGLMIADDIPYELCKEKVASIAKRMEEISKRREDIWEAKKPEEVWGDGVHPGDQEKKRLWDEYFVLEQEMEKYCTAMVSSDEYIQEQKDKEEKWENDHEADNIEALKMIRRHMPITINRLSEEDLQHVPTPNGKYLPKEIARRFKRVNVLQIIRIGPDDLTRLQPAQLENYSVTGMTLTERRAVYHHIRPCGMAWEKGKSDETTMRKWNWFQMMKNNFKENVAKWDHHVEQYGCSPGNLKCDLIGNQCVVKADSFQINYTLVDYGYPDGDEFDKEEPTNRAAREAAEAQKEEKAVGHQAETKACHGKNLIEEMKKNSAVKAAALILEQKHKDEKWEARVNTVVLEPMKDEAIYPSI